MISQIATYRDCFVHLALLGDCTEKLFSSVSESDETFALRVSKVVN